MATFETDTVYQVTIHQPVSDTYEIAADLRDHLKAGGFRDFAIEVLNLDGTVRNTLGVSTAKVR